MDSGAIYTTARKGCTVGVSCRVTLSTDRTLANLQVGPATAALFDVEQIDHLISKLTEIREEMRNVSYSAESVKAARNLLRADDARREWVSRQPECWENGMPYDGERWLIWVREMATKNEAVREAYDALTSTGVAIRCYHPTQYRPIAEKIVSEVAPE